MLIVLFELAITAWTQRLPTQPVIALGYALFVAGYALIGFVAPTARAAVVTQITRFARAVDTPSSALS